MKKQYIQLTHVIGVITFLLAINPYFVLFGSIGYLLYLLLLVSRWKAFQQYSRFVLLLYPTLTSLFWIGMMYLMD